jgi:hypothetical protein
MKKILVTLGSALVLSTSFVVASTAGTVNGIKITVEEANQILNKMTQGKMTWATLPADGKRQLIEMIAPSKLIGIEANKKLTSKEKNVALVNFWMQKKMSEVKVSDNEAKKAYEKMKKAAKESKSKQTIPAFNTAKNSIKMQLAQEKVVTDLVKSSKIKVY